MSTSPLHSARLKLQRAEEFLGEIQADYDRDNAEAETLGPVGIPRETEFEPITGRTWYIVRLPVDPPEPLERWGLIAGDAMHNTRSALDHLACRLVEHNNKPVTTRTAFPICAEEPESARDRGRFEGAIAGMKDEHKDSIRRLQPYANPGSVEAAKLIALAALDNADKHRLLVPVATTIASDEARAPLIATEIPSPFEYRWNGGKKAEKGVELFRFSPSGPIGAIQRFDLNIVVRTTFGDTSTGIRQLREIRAYVVAIVESFGVELG